MVYIHGRECSRGGPQMGRVVYSLHQPGVRAVVYMNEYGFFLLVYSPSYPYLCCLGQIISANLLIVGHKRTAMDNNTHSGATGFLATCVFEMDS